MNINIDKLMNVEEEKLDERQQALCYKIGFKCMRILYVLTFALSTAFLIIYFTAIIAMPPVPYIILAYMALICICISFYMIETSKQGVMKSFTGYKRSKNSKLFFIRSWILLIGIGINLFVTNALSPSDYLFFVICIGLSIIFDIIQILCKKNNQRVIAAQLNEVNYYEE